MASGTWKIHYGFFVKKASDDTNLQVFNDGATSASFPLDISHGKAFSLAAAFVRRFQSVGIDAYALIHGVPVGADSDHPALALPEEPYQVVQLYGRIDTPDYSLRKSIALANRDITGLIDTTVADDMPEDVAT